MRKSRTTLKQLTVCREFEEKIGGTLLKLELGLQKLQRLSYGDSGVNVGSEKEGEDEVLDGSAGMQVDAEVEVRVETSDLLAINGQVGLNESLPKQD